MTGPERSPTADKVIEIEDLVAYYGSRMVLRGVSLDVYDGEIMVIMGSSGSGKSTLLRHMLGLETMASGSVRLLGLSVAEASAKAMATLRRRIGVAFQGGALFSSMTVAENIMLPLVEHTDLDPTTMRIMARLKLEVVGLAGYEHLMPAELSGGMTKRAAFARAIIMDPRILFCDEPSAGLDPAVSAAIDNLILRLREAMRMTIVVVTHDLDSAFRIADRITVLDAGEILLTGTVDEVRRHPSPRIQNLLNRRPQDDILDPEDYLERLTGTPYRASVI